MDRRKFLKSSSAGGAALLVAGSASGLNSISGSTSRKPVIISTWKHGIPANAAAWKILEGGGYALDAVEQGVRTAEDNPKIRSVGYGGRPDREGLVTLDACIQNELSDCGAVSFLQDIRNPISVARKVMEDTPHVMLSGAGARQFALEQGFKAENLLTKESKKDWEQWLETSKYKPVINIENHDTISMLALDSQGRMCGACTTSGAAYKMHGRVGDSPIIGAGLFVDNEVGGACATGLGEAVIRVSGSTAVVELMRHGASPTEACEAVVKRIIKKHPEKENLQVGFLAMNMQGEYGGFSIRNGFNYACTYEGFNELIDTKYMMKW